MPNAAPRGITSLTVEAMRRLMGELGQPAYRAKQLFGWLHARGCGSFEEMTDLPAGLRQRLAEGWAIEAPALAEKQVAGDGTQKLLVALADGSCVETVLMRYRYGPSVCVSSQVGCRMGCRFCASTKAGLVRGLSAGEMAGQVYAAAAEAGERVSHVVLMGIGEPLDNYDSVVDFVRILTHPDGYNISGRAVSLSTSGVVPGIARLAEEGLPLTLSVSLHAADDEKRSRLMPVNDAWPLAELMAACDAYFGKTGRRVSYEYALMAGENDTDEDLRALAGLLKGKVAHVNLIRANEVEGSPYRPSGPARAEAFMDGLKRMGINATLRRRLGGDIDAACGQLRMKRGIQTAEGTDDVPC